MKKISIQNFDLLSPKSERENIQFGLSRTQRALNALNNPCKNIQAIQVIGTNGKGSITAFIESILFEANKNIGVTTSPHLLDICERIKVNKEKINKYEFGRLFQYIDNNLSKNKLSPFEIIICCALKFFDLKKVDLLILEAGLGGRLDATTAHKLRPIIAIGKIGMDHEEYLGNSIEKIAIEKVAVIEKDAFVISSHQNKLVENIIDKRVRQVGAKIIWKESLPDNYELGLKGNFQNQNAAVALGVIEILNNKGFDIDETSILKGLKNTKWPGRLELLYWLNHKILIDSAHNSSAAKALAYERKYWVNQEKGVYWILGVQKQKDISSIIKNLVQKNDIILLVPVPNQKSWTLSEISKIETINDLNIIEFKKFDLAFNYLLDLTEWPSCHPVLTGSIYLIAEFIKFVNNKKL